MRGRAAIIAVGAALLALGCSEPEPLAGIDLPPASLPDEYEPELWTVTFSHGFEAGFWPPGHHVYRLHLDCPDAGAELVDTEPIGFTVNEVTPAVGDDIYLRLVGLSTSLTGPRNVINVGTEQTTVAAVTLLGLDSAGASAAQNCSGSIEFDAGQRAELAPSSPVRP